MSLYIDLTGSALYVYLLLSLIKVLYFIFGSGLYRTQNKLQNTINKVLLEKKRKKIIVLQSSTESKISKDAIVLYVLSFSFWWDVVS